MFIKKNIIGLVLFAALVVPAKSYAESGFCSNVEVIKVGAKDTGKVVLLKNTNTTSTCGNWPLNESRWFVLDNTNGEANSMLAAAILAKSTGQKVLVASKNTNNYTSWSSLVAVYSD